MDYNYSSVKRRSVKSSGKEGRSALRLTVCLGIFAAAFAVKTLFPSAAGRLGGEVLDTINDSADYRAVFSAIGSFVSGETTLGEAIAVIKSGNGAVEAQALSDEVQKEDKNAFAGSGMAEHKLQSMYLQLLEQRLRATNEASAEQTFAGEQAAEQHEAEETLPENVSEAEAQLPFAYTMPVTGTKTSDFGYRIHPIDKSEKFHYGTDFAAAEGTDITAFADGRVVASGVSETAGKYLIISHGDGWVTQYFHCSEVYKTGGSEVKAGDTIAAVGQTGAATGPNLHFELLHDGVYYDPWKILDEES